MQIDCYKLLGVSPDADEKVIRKAWRLKTKEVHPDINPSPEANADFRELTLALEILLDSVARLKHDRHFGYYDKSKNKSVHALQSFSDYQTEKAETTVNEWSHDYEIAMAMREDQRRKHIAKHKRNIRLLQLVFLGIALIMLAVVIFVLSWKP